MSREWSSFERYLVLALVVGFVAYLGLRKQPVEAQSEGPSPMQLSIGACQAAQTAVKAKLKSPSTASFPDCGLEANQYEIRSNAEQTEFSVIGHVDAQNSFGAAKRSKFVVMLSKPGPGAAPSAFSPTEVGID